MAIIAATTDATITACIHHNCSSQYSRCTWSGHEISVDHQCRLAAHLRRDYISQSRPTQAMSINLWMFLMSTSLVDDLLKLKLVHQTHISSAHPFNNINNMIFLQTICDHFAKLVVSVAETSKWSSGYCFITSLLCLYQLVFEMFRVFIKWHALKSKTSWQPVNQNSVIPTLNIEVPCMLFIISSVTFYIITFQLWREVKFTPLWLL